jgi:septum formation protein
MTRVPPLWLAERPLVLASRSEVRRAVLQSAGLSVEAQPADIDERALEQASGAKVAGQVAAFLAAEKARAVARSFPGRLVLGADQTLVAGGVRFSKPAARQAAKEQLQRLAGKTHELHSAIAVMRDNSILFECCEVARMTMRPLSDTMIDAYLDAAGDAAMSSVGAYQIEGPGIQLFEAIDGDYFTILGLPLLPLLAFLRQQKWIAT